jgi:hypothetical protein
VKRGRAGCAGEQIQRGGVMVYALGTQPVHGFHVNVDMLDGDPDAIRSINEEPDGGVAFKGGYGDSCNNPLIILRCVAN